MAIESLISKLKKFGLEIEYSNKQCTIHHVNLVAIKGHEANCPECTKQQINQQLASMQDNLKSKSYKGYLRAHSLVDRSDTYTYTFNNFKVQEGSQEDQIRDVARQIAGEYLKHPEKKFNSLLFGNAGAGKTHLAMAMLNGVNDNAVPMQRCLFISVYKLMRELRSWFGDHNSRALNDVEAEKLISKADLVVIDDLGAESANGDRGASSYVQETIQMIYESNQRIITTTNLSMSELKNTYHSRLLSRIQEGAVEHTIDFSKVNDKRGFKDGRE